MIHAHRKFRYGHSCPLWLSESPWHFPIGRCLTARNMPGGGAAMTSRDGTPCSCHVENLGSIGIVADSGRNDRNSAVARSFPSRGTVARVGDAMS